MAGDMSALVVALIGAVGGGAATGLGGFLRARTTQRTAARLVYAELARNASALAYYRATGTWPSVTTSREAWTSYRETLARVRRAGVFEAVHRGYAALDAVAYIAHDQTLPETDANHLVQANVSIVMEALRCIGARGLLPLEQVEGDIAPLVARTVGARPAQHADAPPSLLVELLSVQLAAGQAPGRALDMGDSQHAHVPPATVDLGAARLRVYDAAGREDLATDRLPVVRSGDGPASQDETVEEIFGALAHTWQFLRDVLDRDSLDGAGGPVEAVAHYGQSYVNTFWDGRLLAVGDGDGVLFGRFSRCVEVLAHELCHALTTQAGLLYRGQAGALNESICDVLGVLVKQWALGQSVEEADWLLGAQLLGPTVAGHGLRSLSAPGTAYDDPQLGKDPQAGHMSGYVRTASDNGGVHVNCGIPSRAFYLLATALGGRAWERPGLLWYRALTSGALTPTASFSSFAGITLGLAQRDDGPKSTLVSAVEDAWHRVGVTPRLTKRGAVALGVEPHH